jgi:hypothetical protein
MPPSDEQPDLKSAFYLRKNLWNGRACVPAILSLHDGRITLRTATEVVLAAPRDAVTGRVTRWGTLLLTHGGKRYDVVGSGSQISPDFTPEMLAELEAFAASSTAGSPPANLPADAAQVAGVGLSMAGAGLTVAANGAMIAQFLRGKVAIDEWKRVFA